MKISSIGGVNFNYMQNQARKVSKSINFGFAGPDGGLLRDSCCSSKKDREVKEKNIENIIAEPCGQEERFEFHDSALKHAPKYPDSSGYDRIHQNNNQTIEMGATFNTLF